MADLVLVLIALAFLGVCVLYIRGCEWIIRNGDAGDQTADSRGEAARAS